MLWFEREFDFTFPAGIYPSLIERLSGLLPRVRAKVEQVPDAPWCERVDGTWSAQENLGHLADLEALWQGRLDDFASGAAVLEPADLENVKTHEAGHNTRRLDEVVAELDAARSRTITRLRALPAADFELVSRHPRLDTPMRLVDLLFFVAEHDDHHLARITELLSRRT